jgi:hypothetical protein
MSVEEEIYGDRCSLCGTDCSYEDMDVVDTVPDDDGYLTIEILVCQWCKDEV